MYRYNRATKVKAINESIREIFPALHRRVDDRTLITGNMLPNAHFERWDSSSYPYKYSLSNATAAETTTAGLIRGGASSAKVTASAANGYMYITSNDYPRLLDMMNKTVTFKCWAYPEVADDAYLVIYTVQADGTAQTLTSTTTCPAGKWTLLTLESQAINDDIVEIQFRFKVATNAKYVYFDNARVIADNQYEYMLPELLQNGDVLQVYVQCSSDADDACDTLQPREWQRAYGYSVIDNNTDRYLRFADLQTQLRQIRIIGMSPLESLTSPTDTVSIDGNQVNLLVAYAKYKLWSMSEGQVASDDIERNERAMQKALIDYHKLLPKCRMGRPSGTLKLPV